jgi:hypothetical protein
MKNILILITYSIKQIYRKLGYSKDMYLRWLSQGVYPEFIIREKWYGKEEKTEVEEFEFETKKG